MRTPIAKAKGLGSAKSGTAHWWRQRLTALGLLPLVVWFVVSMVSLTGADYETMLIWLRFPLVSVLLLIFIALLFYHFRLGLQVVIEDYIASERAKVLSLFVTDAFVWIAGLWAALSVLRVYLGN